MYKYEKDIELANKAYISGCAECRVLNDGILNDVDRELVRMSIFGSTGSGYNISNNVGAAISKYYKWDNEKGYVRVYNGFNRNDRDLFEQNDIRYPFEGGLYLIGQTFFNPITDEKFYWIKVGSGTFLKERRKAYNTYTAMIWDIDYHIENKLTEEECHFILMSKCIYRHADEWFSVSREEYLEICNKGFKYFEERV